MNTTILPQSFTVYILKCVDNTYYVGCTSNFADRIARHTRGEVSYTSSRLPLITIHQSVFFDKYKAYQFENYLKSGSGRAFAKKRFYWWLNFVWAKYTHDHFFFWGLLVAPATESGRCPMEIAKATYSCRSKIIDHVRWKSRKRLASKNAVEKHCWTRVVFRQ